LNSDEEKYSDISRKLKELPKVSAGDDFLLKLHHRIRNIESHSEKSASENFLNRFFENIKNLWIAPALGLTVVLIFATYFIFKSLNNTNDDLTNKTSESKTEINQTQQESMSGLKDEKLSSPISDLKDTNEQNKNFAAVPESESDKKFSNKKESGRYGSDKDIMTLPSAPQEKNIRETDDEIRIEQKAEEKISGPPQKNVYDDTNTGVNANESLEMNRMSKSAEEDSAKDNDLKKDSLKNLKKKKFLFKNKADSLNLESLKVKIDENK